MNDTVADRYKRDPVFRTIVDQLEYLIDCAQYTPTEVREAAMYACIRYEMRRFPPRYVIPLRCQP